MQMPPNPANPESSLTCTGPIQSLASLNGNLAVFHGQNECTVFTPNGSARCLKTHAHVHADKFASDASKKDLVLLGGSRGILQTVSTVGDSVHFEEQTLPDCSCCTAYADCRNNAIFGACLSVAASNRTLLFYDDQKRLQQTLKLQGDAEVKHLLWAGCWLVGARCGHYPGSDGGVFLWAYPDATDAALLPGSGGSSVTSLSVSPSQKLAAAGFADGQVLVWKLPGAEQPVSAASLLAKHSQHAAVQHLSWDANSQQLAVSDGVVASIWGFNKDSVTSLPAVCLGHQRLARITAVAFHSTSQLLATATDMGQVVVYDTTAVEDGMQVKPYQQLSVTSEAICSNTKVSAITWTKGRTLAAGCDDGKVVTWTIPEPPLTPQRHDHETAEDSCQPSGSTKIVHRVIPHAGAVLANGHKAELEADSCTTPSDSRSSVLNSRDPEPERNGDVVHGKPPANGGHSSVANGSHLPSRTSSPGAIAVVPSNASPTDALPQAASSGCTTPTGSPGPVTEAAGGQSGASASHDAEQPDTGSSRQHTHEQQSHAGRGCWSPGGQANGFMRPPFPPHATYPPHLHGPPWSPVQHPPIVLVPTPLHVLPHSAVWPGHPRMAVTMPGLGAGMYGMHRGVPMLMTPAVPLPSQWPPVMQPVPYPGMAHMPQPARGVMQPVNCRLGYESRPAWLSPQSPAMLQAHPPPQQQRNPQQQPRYSSSSGSRHSTSRRSSHPRPLLSPSATSSDFQHTATNGTSTAASGAVTNKSPTTRRGSRGRNGSSGGVSSSITGSDLSPVDSVTSPSKGSTYEATSQSSAAEVADPVKTIWVGNLGGHISEQHLFGVFAVYGTVTRCEVMRERNTRISRGFAFLTFEFAVSAAMARMNMNGAVLTGFGDHPICVDFSNREKEAQHDMLMAISARSNPSPSRPAVPRAVPSPFTPRALFPHRISTSDGETPCAYFDGLTDAVGASRTLSADDEALGRVPPPPPPRLPLPADGAMKEQQPARSGKQLTRADTSTPRSTLVGLLAPTSGQRRPTASAAVAASPVRATALSGCVSISRSEDSQATDVPSVPGGGQAAVTTNNSIHGLQTHKATNKTVQAH